MILSKSENCELRGCKYEDDNNVISLLENESEIQFYSIYQFTRELGWQCYANIFDKNMAEITFKNITNTQQYYYVFGSEAARLYEEGFDQLLQATKDGNIAPELFVWNKNIHPNVLLNVASGYEYYQELSVKEYDELKNA